MSDTIPMAMFEKLILHNEQMFKVDTRIQLTTSNGIRGENTIKKKLTTYDDRKKVIFVNSRLQINNL